MSLAISTKSKSTLATESKGVTNSLSTKGLSKSEHKKPVTFEADEGAKRSGSGYKKSRTCLNAPPTLSKTLCGANSDAKKPASSIRRSKSRIIPGTENHNDSVTNVKEANVKKKGKEKKTKKKIEIVVEPSTLKKSIPSDADSVSISLKSCEDFEMQAKASNSSYKDTYENLYTIPRLISKVDVVEADSEDLEGVVEKVSGIKTKAESSGTINTGSSVISEEINISSTDFVPIKINESKNVVFQGEKIEDENEAKRQDKIIKHLFETIDQTRGPLFESLKWLDKYGAKFNSENRGKHQPGSKDYNLENRALQEGNFSSVQEQYDYTLYEMSEIWKNTISLISSVKEHTLKYVDGKSRSIDKEQLSLEAEMLQLAVDFSINYSKLKTDFLLKAVMKRLNVKELEKSELENFMESKTLAALYNDEDLAAMAQTVKELNNSVLTGGDIELDLST